MVEEEKGRAKCAHSSWFGSTHHFQSLFSIRQPQNSPLNRTFLQMCRQVVFLLTKCAVSGNPVPHCVCWEIFILLSLLINFRKRKQSDSPPLSCLMLIGFDNEMSSIYFIEYTGQYTRVQTLPSKRRHLMLVLGLKGWWITRPHSDG